MDRDTIVARCEARFRDTNNDIISAADWVDYVKDADADVIGAHPLWPFLESRDETLTVSAGAGTVTLPDDGWRVSAVYNATQDEPMSPLTSRSQYRRLYPDPDNNLGVPVHYRLRNNVIEVYPHAESETTLHVDLYLPPAELTSGTAEPVYPSQYHRMLVSGALAYAYEDDGNEGQADRHRRNFDRLLTRMMDDLLSPRTDSYAAITDDWY